MDMGRSWSSAIVAASRIAGHLFSGPVLRGYRTTWGATGNEVVAAWRTLPVKIFTSRTLVEPVSYVMNREMLNNIKKLAESDGNGRAGKSGPVELPTVKPGVVLALVSFQVSLAATAWTDLLFRSSARIRGSKACWVWIATVPFVGPSAYFIRGIRR